MINPILQAMIAMATAPIKAPAKPQAALPEWKSKSRDNKPTKRSAPDGNSGHPQAIQGKKFSMTRTAKGKRVVHQPLTAPDGTRFYLSNHERTAIRRMEK